MLRKSMVLTLLCMSNHVLFLTCEPSKLTFLICYFSFEQVDGIVSIKLSARFNYPIIYYGQHVYYSHVLMQELIIQKCVDSLNIL